MTQHKVCDQCPGVKLVTEQEEIELEIEPGMVNGMQQKFTGTCQIRSKVRQASFQKYVS